MTDTEMLKAGQSILIQHLNLTLEARNKNK